MAFQHPQHRPQVQRQISSTQQDATALVSSPVRKRLVEESQEWILFSPQNDGYSQTSQTPRTATDLGSLETHIRSQPAASAEEVTCQGTEADDENAELDSLDDGLHAFHHHPFSSSSNALEQSGGTVLPQHDGLGTFASSAGFQEQLWQFERYNPHRRRHVRRRSSIQKKLDEVEEEEELDMVDERTARIEKWRLEQSKAVLEEIERETRRRQRRLSRLRGAGTDVRPDLRESVRVDSVIKEEPEAAKAVEQPSESWWQRLTRRVIQDLIGLDESTLSVIFGEDLPADPSPTPTQPSPLAAAAKQESRVTFRDGDDGWEIKLLDRIAKELGILVHQLSETDGAFSTYARGEVSRDPAYAGLAVDMPTRPRHAPTPRHRRRRSSHHATSDALFSPTLQHTPDETDTSLWGIDEEPVTQPPTTDEATQQEREYWERELDLQTLFSHLRRRFSSTTSPTPAQPQAQPDTSPLLPPSWSTNPTTTTSALSSSRPTRADLIRRHHPLISRAAEHAAQQQSRRRESALSSMMLSRAVHKRFGDELEEGGSCASQSTKRSRRSGSTRHFWLDPGSVGSEGVGTGRGEGLGGWGEV
jgi:hypothetical protein